MTTVLKDYTDYMFKRGFPNHVKDFSAVPISSAMNNSRPVLHSPQQYISIALSHTNNTIQSTSFVYLLPILTLSIIKFTFFTKTLLNLVNHSVECSCFECGFQTKRYLSQIDRNKQHVWRIYLFSKIICVLFFKHIFRFSFIPSAYIHTVQQIFIRLST